MCIPAASSLPLNGYCNDKGPTPHQVFHTFLPEGVFGDLPADRRVPQPPQHEHVEYDDDGERDGVAGDEEGELPDGQVVPLLVELTPL